MPTLLSSASARAIASARGTFSTWIGASMTFSSTVMWDHRLKLWNTMASSERMRSTCLVSSGTAWPSRLRFILISSPRDDDRPESGVSSRLMQRRKVLLPEPRRRSCAIRRRHARNRDALQHLELPKRLVQILDDQRGRVAAMMLALSSRGSALPCRQGREGPAPCQANSPAKAAPAVQGAFASTPSSLAAAAM